MNPIRRTLLIVSALLTFTFPDDSSVLAGTNQHLLVTKDVSNMKVSRVDDGTDKGPSVSRATEGVVKDIHLSTEYTILKIVIRRPYAYILSTLPDSSLWIHLAELDNDRKWAYVGGSAMPIMDKPRKLFRRDRGNLEYSLTSRTGEREGVEYHFDWCLYGYTTDPKVTSIRLKTSEGYVPLETISGRYFMRIMDESERRKFVEVQGLNSKGEVIQRDNGVDEDKPQQWSPRHSELY